MMPSWFVVNTKVGQEFIAVENLERQGFDVFLPVVRNAKRLRGRLQPPLEALFPGYLFSRLDPKLQDVSPIRSTRGVIDLVRLGSKLIPVPEALVANLQEFHENGSIDHYAAFKRGDAVTFVDGPFKGLSGIFQARSSLERVAVLLDLIGQQNKLSVPLHQIEPK